jgi:hypothetical protein
MNGVSFRKSDAIIPLTSFPHFPIVEAIMNFFFRMSPFALGPLISAACKAIGLETVGRGLSTVARLISDRISDHSLCVSNGLTEASNQAWELLKVALSGESLLDVGDRADDKAFREQIRLFVRSGEVDKRIAAHALGSI